MCAFIPNLKDRVFPLENHKSGDFSFSPEIVRVPSFPLCQDNA